MSISTTPTLEIILDGISYNVSNFSPTIQAIVNMRNRWEGDLVEERAAVLKTESAIRTLDDQLTKTVTEELQARAKVAGNEDSYPEASE